MNLPSLQIRQHNASLSDTESIVLLCRLCVVFLAFDVFFVVFCVALACVIGIAVCCCLPCIIAILYAVADQEGASEDDIRALPLFKFRVFGGGKEGLDEGGVLTPLNGGAERKVSADNAVRKWKCFVLETSATLEKGARTEQFAFLKSPFHFVGIFRLVIQT
jgi:hypothetical protein